MHSISTVIPGEREIAKEKFYATKMPFKIWDVIVDNKVILKLVITKTNSKYLIGYLDKTVRPIWTKIEELKNIKSNALPVYDDRYIKTKIRTYGDKVYASFLVLNTPENYIELESFTVISIESLLKYENKYYLQVYLNNCAYKIVNKQMTDYLDENLFED